VDLPLMLAMEVSDGAIWGAILGLAGAAGGAVKAVWWYLTEREKKRAELLKQAHDAALSTKDGEITRLRDEVKDLGKRLAKKSDDHAAKVEELMLLALTKVEEGREQDREAREEWSERDRESRAEILKALVDFNATVNRLNPQKP